MIIIIVITDKAKEGLYTLIATSVHDGKKVANTGVFYLKETGLDKLMWTYLLFQIFRWKEIIVPKDGFKVIELDYIVRYAGSSQRQKNVKFNLLDNYDG